MTWQEEKDQEGLGSSLAPELEGWVVNGQEEHRRYKEGKDTHHRQLEEQIYKGRSFINKR